MMPFRRLQRGDQARVRLAGDAHWCPAWVALASETNPSSVCLLLDGGVRTKQGGILASVLPLSINYETETVTSLFHDEYEIEVQE